jgi:hypothetical protein
VPERGVYSIIATAYHEAFMCDATTAGIINIDSDEEAGDTEEEKAGGDEEEEDDDGVERTQMSPRGG